MRGRGEAFPQRAVPDGRTGAGAGGCGLADSVRLAGVNYLAHLFLADRHGLSLSGTLLGDYVKGEPESAVDPDQALAVRLHRRVDSFTDGHPVFLRSKRRVAPARRRVSGILVDVFYDHVLARDWERYVDEPLDVFNRRIYAALAQESGGLPDPLPLFVRRIRQVDLFGSYRKERGIARALGRLSKRLSRPTGLEDGAEDLAADNAGFTEDFHDFFPELLRFFEEETARRREGNGA